GEHKRSVHPQDKDGQGREVLQRSRLDPADDVGRQVEREEEDREQGGDSQQDAVFHVVIPGLSSKAGAMRVMVEAPLRAGNRIATKRGFAWTNGGYIRRNRCR